MGVTLHWKVKAPGHKYGSALFNLGVFIPGVSSACLFNIFPAVFPDVFFRIPAGVFL